MPQPNPNQHYRLSLEKAKQDYKDGIITATGLVYYTVGIYRAPGHKLRVKDIDQFCQQIGINRSAFYKAISKLKTKGRLNWEAIGGVDLWIPTSNVVEIQSGQEVSPNGECLSPNGDEKFSEPLTDGDSGNSPDFLQISSNSFSNEQQQDPAAAQEKKGKDSELNTPKKLVTGLRLPQKTSDEFGEELETAVRLQEIKCTPAIEINQTVLTALRNYPDHVDDAILYLKECLRTWDSYKGTHHNWTGVLVKALKEGLKPKFSSGSAAITNNSPAAAPLTQPAEIHPLLQAGLDSGEISELDPIHKGVWQANGFWEHQHIWLALRLNEIQPDS